MIPHELLEYYESLVTAQAGVSIEESEHLKAFITEIRDLSEKRVILRELRYRSGMPVCSGDVECLENPTARCMRGEHPTCSDHTDSCFLCIPKARLR